MAAFVRGTMEGWKSYLADPAPANALIKKDNPNMSDEQLTYSVAKLKEMGIVTGGGASKNGIGSMDIDRVRKNHAFLLENKLVDAGKLGPTTAYNFDYIKDLKVMP
jgi:NitT/TauT family transport system substrate-binding protein